MGGNRDPIEVASQAINKFVNELWETFGLSEKFGVDGPEGDTPTERKEDTIAWLRDLMNDPKNDVAVYYYKNGAKRGVQEFLKILKMQKQAGVQNRTKVVSRRDWQRAVEGKFEEAEQDYSDQAPPW